MVLYLGEVSHKVKVSTNPPGFWEKWCITKICLFPTKCPSIPNFSSKRPNMILHYVLIQPRLCSIFLPIQVIESHCFHQPSPLHPPIHLTVLSQFLFLLRFWNLCMSLACPNILCHFRYLLCNFTLFPDLKIKNTLQNGLYFFF